MTKMTENIEALGTALNQMDDFMVKRFGLSDFNQYVELKDNLCNAFESVRDEQLNPLINSLREMQGTADTVILAFDYIKSEYDDLEGENEALETHCTHLRSLVRELQAEKMANLDVEEEDDGNLLDQIKKLIKENKKLQDTLKETCGLTNAVDMKGA